MLARPAPDPSRFRSGMVRGAVVDGGWRDIAELQALSFPVFGRGVSAFSPPKTRLGEINVPVCCGGVVVNAGDIIVGDREGMVVVPREFAPQVAASLRQYEPHRSVDEWDRERLEEARAERLERFEEIVRELGGSIESADDD